jgi:hypothetical protein
MKPVLFIALLALSGCADTRQYSLNEQCVREPGCVSTFSDHGGAPHAACHRAEQCRAVGAYRQSPQGPQKTLIPRDVAFNPRRS